MSAPGDADPRGVAELPAALDPFFDLGNHNGVPRLIDLCFTIFMASKQPNDEDGGPSDWFNDTKPKADRLVREMRGLFATALAASEADRAALERRVAELEADKARLDFLDRCNTALNARYGTSYRWRLVLNHNVNRLMLGHGDVDLHDSDGSNTALPSCREAIDEQMRDRAAARALTPGASS